jgi:hypothetical protein
MLGNDRSADLPTNHYGRWNDYQNSDAAYPAGNFGPLHGVVEVVAPPPQGKHFLWQVDYGLSRAFILGSIHVLRSTDHPLPGLFTEAFNQTSKVYFETDLDALATAPVQSYMLSRASYPSGQNLQAKLPSATYTKIRNFATSQGLPADYFRPYRPWFASAVMGNLANEDLAAVQAHGVDQHFFNLAKSQGRTVKIYRTPTKGHESFTVSYYQDKKRLRSTFAEFAEAEREARDVATRLASSNAVVLTLSSADRAAWLRAKELSSSRPPSSTNSRWVAGARSRCRSGRT